MHAPTVPKCGDLLDNLMPAIHVQLADQFFQDAIACAEVHRYGEARHPGPAMVIRTFNPSQLLGREDEISEWPDGVWTAAETSHTQAAMHVARKRFHHNDVRTIFSMPVEKHSSNTGTYRGKAMGTAIMSRLQMTPFPMEVEESVLHSRRFCDALVHFGRGLYAYVCVVYGPPINNYIYADGERVFLNTILPGLQRATTFRGPAVITGDFNRDLGDCVFWEELRAKGWYDCAELAWERWQKPPEPTCKDSSRRSFILVNAAMAQFFLNCGTVEHYMFDAHPVLEATFDMGDKPAYKQVWSLPKSLDGFLFDPGELELHASEVCAKRHDKFQNALGARDADEALRQFALAFEEVYQKSAVDVEGQHVQLPAACLKRCRSKVVKHRPVGACVVKKSREGDVNVPLGQTSLQTRRFVTQARRLLSLKRQLWARQQNPSGEICSNVVRCG